MAVGLIPAFKKICRRQTRPPPRAVGSVNRSLLSEAVPQNACSCRKHQTGMSETKAQRRPGGARGGGRGPASPTKPGWRRPGAEAAGLTPPRVWGPRGSRVSWAVPWAGRDAAPPLPGRRPRHRPLAARSRPERRSALSARGRGAAAAGLRLQVREGGRAALAAAGRGAQQGGPGAGLCGEAGERLR